MAFAVHNMYVLCELKPRAETTDTVLHCASNDRRLLEEILLSMYDEIYEKELEWHDRENFESPLDYASLKKWCMHRLSNYKIIKMPYMEV